ncbi:merR HTH regulatory family protein [Clostridium argentinense CDC 2741]|uniref:MerR HTH regulatory family protein n=1 Tax=Clostridium argentinense CDC 2741 TaxID=1418104 RepID=A0A0C1RCS2_9CLOT|nr:merR HTH regulatory family protein [Clostridium argentinense CDC 2741]NFF40393.1 MerR family transcriptional regulator [Clostridium argentinense]NFP50468.1 MerR family transcriptional regulator [Clostridium argentinense]NFP74829.1 MerR family transcriptional regulator [Clostridium argentinense]NFP77562.1 MerR family transcriptional regulator [Clostridium argentinense]
MENYLKISELAKLMKVSVHQLRYFEKKGYFHLLILTITVTECMESMKYMSFHKYYS